MNNVLNKSLYNYNEIPDTADLMTMEEFLAQVKSSTFMDDDGIGYYSDGSFLYKKKFEFKDYLSNIDTSFTHIVWFGK